ncbi:FBXO48, partial [Cervus elaphus hippelaphus]
VIYEDNSLKYQAMKKNSKRNHGSRVSDIELNSVDAEKEKKECQNNFVELLPPEVTFKIFSQLDIRSLCRASVTCRSWNHAIRHSDSLWKPHCLTVRAVCQREIDDDLESGYPWRRGGGEDEETQVNLSFTSGGKWQLGQSNGPPGGFSRKLLASFNAFSGLLDVPNPAISLLQEGCLEEVVLLFGRTVENSKLDPNPPPPYAQGHRRSYTKGSRRPSAALKGLAAAASASVLRGPGTIHEVVLKQPPPAWLGPDSRETVSTALRCARGYPDSEVFGWM